MKRSKMTSLERLDVLLRLLPKMTLALVLAIIRAVVQFGVPMWLIAVDGHSWQREVGLVVLWATAWLWQALPFPWEDELLESVVEEDQPEDGGGG